MRIIAAALLVTSMSVPALAQPPTASLEGYGEADTLKITGSDLPFYYVVFGFFETGTSWLTEWGAFYDEHLIDLGVTPGSDAAKVVTDAMLAAGPIVHAHAPIDRKLVGNPAAFEAAQVKQLREQADKLATIYAEMMVGLEEAGFDPLTIEVYLENTTRQRSGLYLVGKSKQRFEHSRGSLAGWLGVDGFEQQVAERMDVVRRNNQ